MYCKKCGTWVEPGVKYCTRCGAPVYDNNDNDHTKKESSHSGLIIALVIALIVAVAAVCFLLYRQNSGSKKSSLKITYDSESKDESEKNTSNKTEKSDQKAEIKEDQTQSDIQAKNKSTQVPAVANSMITGASASTELYEPKYNIAHYASYVLDGKDSTAWSEAASGTGIGENLTINLDRKCRVSGFSIKDGYQKSARLYKRNCRPSQLLVSFSDGDSETIHLEDRMGWQNVTFSEPHDTSSVTFTIQSVYHGSVYQDTLITELELN